MLKNLSKKNLQNAVFKGEDLSNASFSGSDLRGANFSGANLTGADFTGVRTGITPVNTVLIFFLALAISLFSGLVAMLTGRTVQGMLKSNDQLIRIAGIIAIALSLLFILYVFWKGGGTAIRNLILPACFIALVIGLVADFTGLGTGLGMLYLVLSIVLLVAMFVVGTIARAAAGALSNILFLIVAVSGASFGRSVGGGIGTVVMAISCALISKRALANAKGFEGLRRLAFFITTKFGTSFRDSILTDTDFSHSMIRNTDFTGSDVSLVKWGDSRKVNCVVNENLVTEKKKKKVTHEVQRG